MVDRNIRVHIFQILHCRIRDRIQLLGTYIHLGIFFRNLSNDQVDNDQHRYHNSSDSHTVRTVFQGFFIDASHSFDGASRRF